MSYHYSVSSPYGPLIPAEIVGSSIIQDQTFHRKLRIALRDADKGCDIELEFGICFDCMEPGQWELYQYEEFAALLSACGMTKLWDTEQLHGKWVLAPEVAWREPIPISEVVQALMPFNGGLVAAARAHDFRKYMLGYRDRAPWESPRNKPIAPFGKPEARAAGGPVESCS
ncbi:hypothetical protein [Rhodobacteraceae bacterium DSL-40]|uniref:hypothetical protein n=1 Tax=Amaricoccus sp. B4 TaxID=3368557 RepID=UPI000DAE6ED4